MQELRAGKTNAIGGQGIVDFPLDIFLYGNVLFGVWHGLRLLPTRSMLLLSRDGGRF